MGALPIWSWLISIQDIDAQLQGVRSRSYCMGTYDRCDRKERDDSQRGQEEGSSIILITLTLRLTFAP